MAEFDLKMFDKAQFKERTAAVAVTSKALAPFFKDGEKKEFTVKGLSGEEMSRCVNAHERMSNIKDALEAILGSGKDKVAAIKEMLSLSSDGIEADLARRIEMLSAGCVNPVLDVQQSAKIFRVAYIDAKNLSDQVLILSGQGMMPGELRASGQEATSSKPVTSDTIKKDSCTK